MREKTPTRERKKDISLQENSIYFFLEKDYLFYRKMHSNFFLTVQINLNLKKTTTFS